MLETLIYLLATVVAVLILVWFAPDGTPLLPLITGATVLFTVLATARHGPKALSAVLDALSRLIHG